MKGTESTILKFIGGIDKAFVIPPFQRNYEWGKEQCKELFGDILESCSSGRTHYLGNITYYEGEKSGASYTELILIDGQQRVTTILILLCALRDVITDNTKKDRINRHYLLNEDADDTYRIRLKQTMYDATSFEEMIDEKPPTKPDSNVILNYNLFKKLINDSKVDPIKIFETIPKLEVVDVNLNVTNDLRVVQTVFEKINSTGKPLTPADLIRNLVLLTHSSKEQKRLYTNYWVKIEERLKSENVSKFARDFLILKTQVEVLDKQTYQTFKAYFSDKESNNEEILKEMLDLSKYYEWIRFESCPNEKINRCIKILNLLKTDDLYPLYMFLLFKMYDMNPQELLKILTLLSNFCIRYRIVAPAGGSGAIRSVVNNLIRSLMECNIAFTHGDLHKELSNSPSAAGRYPDDEDFKRQLLQRVNTSYARILLAKIEEFETKNIPVDIGLISVEHLMPQTLSTWWIKNLGGKEESDRIYNTYLNCIGNLALVSPGYNSAMSNNPWKDKLENLRQVQFTITSEVHSKFQEWQEKDIQARNEDFASRAILAVVGPLERTRPYTSTSSETYQPGRYPASDVTTPLAYSSPTAIFASNGTLSCENWKDYVATICGEMLERNEKLFLAIVEKNQVHKTTRKVEAGKYDPIITDDAKNVVLPIRIADSIYFAEGSLSNEYARRYGKQILEIFDCLEEFGFEVQ